MSNKIYIRGKSLEPRFTLTEEQLKNMIHMTRIERARKIGGGMKALMIKAGKPVYEAVVK